MAEFQEVMNQFNRMCWHYQRKRMCPMACPMNGVNISQCRKIAFERPKETEEIVMSWAAEHPEPVYPTFREWLISIGVIGQMSTHSVIADKLSMTPIPADIAEKLGVKPEEPTL